MKLFRILVAAVVFGSVCVAIAQTKTPQVAFTFDDLPAHGPLPPDVARPEVVRSILATLKAEKMPPVYGFVNGFRLTGYPYQADILKDWVKAGEPLGSHTFSHLSLDVVSAERFEEDIAANEPILKRVDPNGDWHWFRYPFLDEGDTLAKRQAVRGYLNAHGYKVAEVTMDFEDYLWNEPYARCMAKHDDAGVAYLEKSYLETADEFIGVFRDLSKQLYGHEIPYVLLMHVGAFDAKMLPRLIALFRSKGFEFVTLEQAQKDPAYSFDPNIGYPGGGTLEELVAKIKGVNFPDNTKPYKKLEKLCQ
ncbi:polysaccharide deacetylase family protein [Granulicella paludicola]|uniref:polysaccharide deacetylase family protein n=1 Tax=Granulicella paludicola TaxID=474951 RepID=UPI0021DFB291|nr:polysaccharide deacetylase family protein [Granulicella paludicola]